MADEWLQKLEDRSYVTYLARVSAARRLRAREHSWNAFLISLTVATTLASIVLLTDSTILGERGEEILVCLAVLGLVASILVPSLNYARRSRDMFGNYRRIQRLSSEVERLRTSGKVAQEDANELFLRYQGLLDESENHTTLDYARARASIRPNHVDAADQENGDGETNAPLPAEGGVRRRSTVGEFALTAVPYLALAIPLLLLTRIGFWLAGG